ncbi:hypothetical protein RHECNPAF_3340040 [Rhizobium etli CNPAF512]|nr:hypothetical protein RHECNPAF_3340040 [Rhizobium etli CNPAF512]
MAMASACQFEPESIPLKQKAGDIGTMRQL